MANSWTEFVKQYAKEKGLPYNKALKEAKGPYQKMKAKGSKSK